MMFVDVYRDDDLLKRFAITEYSLLSSDHVFEERVSTRERMVSILLKYFFQNELPEQIAAMKNLKFYMVFTSEMNVEEG